VGRIGERNERILARHSTQGAPQKYSLRIRAIEFGQNQFCAGDRTHTACGIISPPV
jgi:hypothetical protein